MIERQGPWPKDSRAIEHSVGDAWRESCVDLLALVHLSTKQLLTAFKTPGPVVSLGLLETCHSFCLLKAGSHRPTIYRRKDVACEVVGINHFVYDTGVQPSSAQRESLPRVLTWIQ